MSGIMSSVLNLLLVALHGGYALSAAIHHTSIVRSTEHELSSHYIKARDVVVTSSRAREGFHRDSTDQHKMPLSRNERDHLSAILPLMCPPSATSSL